MKPILFFCFLITFPLSSFAQEQKPIEKRKAFIDSLIVKMTLEEKAGQLINIGDDCDDLETLIKQGKVGATNGLMPGKDVSSRLKELQQMAMHSRLKIPLLFSGDVTHGYRTTFPVNLATASSWDMDLIRKMDSVAAFEATAAGMNWNFSPMVDISRDPRWGRVVEGAGEDPFLGSAVAAAAVKGFQGNDLSHPRTMAATAKHFAAYGTVEAGRDYNAVDMSWQKFYEIYLPPFQAAIEAGVTSIMPAFVSLNGVPASESEHLLKKILRKENTYNGLLVSDYDAIPELMDHRVAANYKAAAQTSLDAGIDMDLHSGTYLKVLPELVMAGKIEESQLDSAVRRVLVVKYKLGLFDHPLAYGNKSAAYQETLLEKHRPLARQMGRESIVLLKNDHLKQQEALLPLAKDLRTLAVIGPLAKDQTEVLGPVHAAGRSEETISVWQGIKEAVSAETKLLYAEGTGINSDSADGFEKAVSVAEQADVVVMAMGESTAMSGEGDSRSMLGLPGNQLDLVKAVGETGKPVVLLLTNGRPLTIPWLDEHIPAILETWELGTETGHAVAEVLFGDYNPSGKLTMTFPRNTGQIPIYYNHLNTGRPFVKGDTYTTRYVDVPNSPLYPFGYGLSYARFSYSIPKLNTKSLKGTDTLKVSVKVTNESSREGHEIAQLYISDKLASVSPPVKKLRGFKRVFLKPHETRTLTFNLTQEDLSFYNADLKSITEPGEFEVFVGGSSATENKSVFELGE